MKLLCEIRSSLTKLVLITVSLGISVHVFAQSILDQFPMECSMASDREALPGHIIRLGFVNKTPMGRSLLFPDQRIGERLQRVGIADNVGVIGQDPDDDLSDMIKAQTPGGSFVVAQIFVGDETAEPVVTCISKPRMLSSYQPSYYGSDFLWLEPVVFRRWLKFERYDDWGWRRWYGRDFGLIRNKYREYHREHRPGAWKHREHDKRMRDNVEKGHHKHDRRDLERPKQIGVDHDKSPVKMRGKGFLDMKKGDTSSQDKAKSGMNKVRDQKPPTIKKTSMQNQPAAEEQEKKPGGRGGR